MRQVLPRPQVKAYATILDVIAKPQNMTVTGAAGEACGRLPTKTPRDSRETYLQAAPGSMMTAGGLPQLTPLCPRRPPLENPPSRKMSSSFESLSVWCVCVCVVCVCVWCVCVSVVCVCVCGVCVCVVFVCVACVCVCVACVCVCGCVVCVWCVSVVCVCVWCVCVVCVCGVCVWVCGVCGVCVWCVCGVCMVCVWCVCVLGVCVCGVCVFWWAQGSISCAPGFTPCYVFLFGSPRIVGARLGP